MQSILAFDSLLQLSSESNQQSFFRFITDKIAQTDLSGYLTQYPPLFTWKPRKPTRNIREWGENLSGDRLGLYVHIPFCEHKCAYCRYFSKEQASLKFIQRYLDSLNKEMKIYAPYFKGKKIHTLYIGGGTPSILSASQLDGLFDSLKNNFTLKWVKQICVEVNPGSASYEKLKILKEIGVNRLTVGIQSLSKKVLTLVNRNQDPAQALECLYNARKMRFETINVDLMAGLPGESLKSFLNGVDKVLSLKPGMIHIHSFYPTRHTRFIEQGNFLDKAAIGLRNSMCQLGAQEIMSGGYKMISFDALGLKRQDRNIQLADAIEAVSSFLGLGACAVSHVKGKLRYINEEDIDAYIRKLEGGFLPVKAGVAIGKEEEMVYYIMAVLRYGPLSKKKFRNLFKEDMCPRFSGVIKRLEKNGFLRETSSSIIPCSSDAQEHAIYAKYFYERSVLQPFLEEFKLWAREDKPAYL